MLTIIQSKLSLYFFTKVTYDTALSTTPTGIRNFVANLLGLPLDKTALAKHKFESFKWIKIEDKVYMYVHTL